MRKPSPDEKHLRETEHSDNANNGSKATFDAKEIQRYSQDQIHGGTEGQARITTESHTDLLEKVVVTHDISIAWPIRLSSVNVLEHVSDTQQNTKSPSLPPSITHTQETRPKSNDANEITLRPTLSMSLSLFNPNSLQGTSLNIEARVQFRSGSPECNVSVKNILGPLSRGELEGLNIEGPQVQLSYTNPKEQETVVNQWHIKTNSTFRSGTPDVANMEPVQLIEPADDDQPERSVPPVQLNETQKRQSSSKSSDHQSDRNVRVDIPVQQDALSAQSSGLQPRQSDNKIASEIAAEEIPDPNKRGVEEEGEQKMISPANVTGASNENSENNQPAEESEKTTTQGRCLCTSQGNQAELIGGQATICAEHPKQLIYESCPENICSVDLKVDNIPISTSEENFEVKLGHVESDVSHRSEVVSHKRSENSDSQAEQQPNVTMQTAFSIAADNEDDINVTDPVGQPKEALVIQTAASANIPEVQNEIEIAEIDGSIRTQHSESKTAIEHVPEDQAGTVEQQFTTPANLPLSVKKNESEASVKGQPNQAEFRVEESFNEYHSNVEPMIGDDQPVLATSPELQPPTGQNVDQCPEEKIFDQGTDTKPTVLTETEQMEGMSTLRTSDTYLPDIKDDMDKPDQPTEAILLNSFHLRSSSKKSVAETSNTDLIYQETAKELTSKVLEGMKDQVFSNDDISNKQHENRLTDPISEFTEVDKASGPPTEPLEQQQTIDPSMNHELPEEMADYITSPSQVNSARTESNVEFLKSPSAPSYMTSEIMPVKTETSLESIDVQPQTILRDAEVNTREIELFPVVEDDVQEESEWSHSMHRYRHHHRHLHPGAGGERSKHIEVGPACGGSHKQGISTRSSCHFGHGTGKSKGNQRPRSKTVPRTSQNMCGQCAASKLLADIEDVGRKGTSVDLKCTDDYSDETSSTTQTCSETSEMQRMTMTLLNTLTTTAELLRNQYKRRKAQAMKSTPKHGKAEMRNHQSAAEQMQTEIPVLKHITTEPSEINIAQNSSCAVPYHPMERISSMTNSCKMNAPTHTYTLKTVRRKTHYPKVLKSTAAQCGVGRVDHGHYFDQTMERDMNKSDSSTLLDISDLYRRANSKVDYSSEKEQSLIKDTELIASSILNSCFKSKQNMETTLNLQHCYPILTANPVYLVQKTIAEKPIPIIGNTSYSVEATKPGNQYEPHFQHEGKPTKVSTSCSADPSVLVRMNSKAYPCSTVTSESKRVTKSVDAILFPGGTDPSPISKNISFCNTITPPGPANSCRCQVSVHRSGSCEFIKFPTNKKMNSWKNGYRETPTIDQVEYCEHTALTRSKPAYLDSIGSQLQAASSKENEAFTNQVTYLMNERQQPRPDEMGHLIEELNVGNGNEFGVIRNLTSDQSGVTGLPSGHKPRISTGVDTEYMGSYFRGSNREMQYMPNTKINECCANSNPFKREGYSEEKICGQHMPSLLAHELPDVTVEKANQSSGN